MRWNKQVVKDYDKKRFSNYGGKYVHRRELGIIFKYVKGLRGKLLDMPCGTGRFIEPLQLLGFNVMAGDNSKDMLNIVKKKYQVKTVECNAFSMPFKDETFDVVVCARLLFHYLNPHLILKELLRVTKKGGTVIFCTLNKWSIRRWIEAILMRDNLYFTSRRELGELNVVETESLFVLPTQIYCRLPVFIVKLLSFIEKVTPDCFKILRYWKVVK